MYFFVCHEQADGESGGRGGGAVFIASNSLKISLDNSNWVWFLSFSKNQIKSNAISFRQCIFGSVVTTIFFVEKLDIWIYATMHSLHAFVHLVSEGDIPRFSVNSQKLFNTYRKASVLESLIRLQRFPVNFYNSLRTPFCRTPLGG